MNSTQGLRWACPLALAATLAVFAVLGAGSAAAAVTLPTGFKSETALQVSGQGLEFPTVFRFAPDGRTFVALKGGKILVYPKGATSATQPTIFANLAKQVFDKSDDGLLGLALDPKFDEGRPYVYALYTFNHELGKPPGVDMPAYPSPTTTGPSAYEGDECAETNKCIVSGRLVRLTAEGNRAKESGGEAEQTVLIEDWCNQSESHSVGDLQFGPEGALYVSGGEGGIYTNPDYGQYENLCGDPDSPKGTSMTPNPGAEGGSLRAQSIFRPNGEVLLGGTLARVNPDTGEGWPGNPYAGSANANKARIVAMGFRNPFRFVINPRLGDVFLGNVGANTYEEIDRIPLGGPLYNSGWPCYEGLGPNPDFQSLNLNACNRLYQVPNSTETPFFYYSHTSPIVPGDNCPTNFGSAISGQAFYEGSNYPSQYHDAFFFADSVHGCIYMMPANEEGQPDPGAARPFLADPDHTYAGVDLEQGPEGNLFYADLVQGSINRITYDPGAPTAALKVVKNPSGPTENPWGPTGNYEFDASESTAAEGHTLKYEWEIQGGNGQFQAGMNSAKQSFSFPESKNYTVEVRVTDQSNGKSSIARLTAYPGDSPPKVTISKPVPSLTWGVGQRIEFAGEAIAEGGSGAPLLNESLYWKTRLLHCPFEASSCHEHPLQVFPGQSQGTVTAPDHDYPSYIHFFLTATDLRGLSAEAEVKVKARPVSLAFRSEPTGVGILAGTQTFKTPGELLAIENSPTTVIAPEAIEYEGVRCTFERWSDGGARVHEVPTNVSGTFTAVYAGPTGPGSCHKSSGGSGSGGGNILPVGPIVPPAPVKQPKIHKRPQKRTTSTTAKFVFGGPVGAKFSCKLDKGSFVPCRSPRVYRRLRSGAHTMRIYATTAAGRSPATVFSWRIVAAKGR